MNHPSLDYSLEYCIKTLLKTRDQHRDRTPDWTRYSRPDLDMSAGNNEYLMVKTVAESLP